VEGGGELVLLKLQGAGWQPSIAGHWPGEQARSALSARQSGSLKLDQRRADVRHFTSLIGLYTQVQLRNVAV
jgi:hypothetical protein